MTATVEPGETVEPGDRTARVVVRRLPGFDPTAPVIPAPRRPTDTDPPEAAAFPDSGGVDPAYVRLVLRLVLEVLHRRRPPTHLAGALGVRARRYVASMTGRLGEHPGAGPGRRRAGGTPVGSTPVGSTPVGSTPVGGRPVRGRLGGGLHTVRICSPADGIAEVGAVWADRNRYRALAARFERDRPTPTGPPRWYCTEIRLG
ncbi:hypothetical protein GCM10023321_17180 [Pseudonocardia eucalypti]|uniref:Uncharacterized protein n=1 Tax=Pseudonocardia eucalypti TaxID=648755 RepID=A0ABP9PRM9_9PSEU|nr:hypothetical protein [Pseudonocardia eucalypti]